MSRSRAVLAAFLALVLSSCGSAEPRAPVVLATLTDGQVLVGELNTRAFTLATSLGTLAFDAKDAGELGPLEGGDMEQSGAAVRLWLRDGSEFVGKWHVWFGSGTRLVAGAAQKALDLKLMLGPESVSVPISSVVYMDRQALEPQAEYPATFLRRGPVDEAEEGVQSVSGFYSNAAQRDSKTKAGSSWNGQKGK